MYQRPDAPRSIGGTLDDGFSLFKACFSQVFVLAFVAAVLGQIPSVMLNSSTSPDNPLPEISTGLVVAFLLSTLVSALIYGAIIAKIDSVARSRPINLSQAFAVGLQRFLPLVICGVLYAIAVTLGPDSTDYSRHHTESDTAVWTLRGCCRQHGTVGGVEVQPQLSLGQLVANGRCCWCCNFCVDGWNDFGWRH